jgi:hypothetical protein
MLYNYLTPTNKEYTMSSDSQYVKSTKEGYHWNLYTHMPQGRPGYAVAVEGKVEMHNGGAIRSFETVIFQDRQIRHDIPGRMTTKSRNAALQALWDKMQEAGLIDKAETLKPVA